MNKTAILNMLWERPIELGHWVGFKDLTSLHNDWLRGFLYNKDDQTLQGHRGSYKTTTLSLFFALHIILMPNETVLFFRKTGGDVNEILRQTSNILHSGAVQKIVQELYGVELRFKADSSSQIDTNLATGIKGSVQLSGLGIGTSITGKHADIVVTDDIVNINDRISQAERERTKIAYMELQNIKNRGGRFINTGTPWHKEDAFILMPNVRKFDCYSTGLITPAQLDELRSRMSAGLFAANYELRHIASDDIMFPNPAVGAEAGPVFNGIAHVDSAFYGEDYTAMTIGRVAGGKLYLFGKIWRKHVEDCYSDILELYRHFLCGKLYMERNADKGMVAKDLRKLGIRTVSYDERMNKHIKIATYLKSVWKNVIFVEGTDPLYIEQICDYTENAEHDDAPDSAACVARQLYGKDSDNQYQPIIM